MSAISRRYAKALLTLGEEQKNMEQYSDELSQLTSIFSEQETLRQLVESPTCGLKNKTAILSDLTDKLEFSEGMKKFVGLLLEKDRMSCLDQIAAVYRRLVDEKSGIVRARISTAIDLESAQAEAIKSGLERQTGKQVELKVGRDPALIGGIKAQIGGKVFDGSVKTQLKRIEDTLKKG
ncbi:MAG TPA: F0F1 ATP synthase subunit delta [Desulfuromonadales bacterium]|nr:F0F1 ATP synthase subunit delta [Desulfuromonadales bacterium]